MTSKKFKIRRFTPEDRYEILKLHHKALVSAGTYFWHLGLDQDLGKVDDGYIKKGGDFLVGVLDNKIIATGVLKKISKKSAQIKRMRVDPGFQRRGYGGAILKKLEKRATELGFKRIELDSIAARGFYEKNGYQEFKRDIIFGKECVFYEKML